MVSWGGKLARWAVLIIYMVIAFTSAMNVSVAFAPDFFEWYHVAAIGTTAWAVLISATIRHFLVSVPEWTGLVTVNMLTGRMTNYGTGLHLRFPWEQVRIGNYINLRLVTALPALGTFPSKDGPMMLVKWSYQYRPLLSMLHRYISADATTINKGVEEVGSSLLSREIARRKSQECKDQQEQIEKELVSEFEAENLGDLHPAQLYGVDLLRVSLGDVDFEESVQKARAADEITKKVQEQAKSIKDQHPKMSDKDAMNTALVLNGFAKKEIFEVEGRAGSALSALIMAAARGRSK